MKSFSSLVMMVLSTEYVRALLGEHIVLIPETIRGIEHDIVNVM